MDGNAAAQCACLRCGRTGCYVSALTRRFGVAAGSRVRKSCAAEAGLPQLRRALAGYLSAWVAVGSPGVASRCLAQAGQPWLMARPAGVECCALVLVSAAAVGQGGGEARQQPVQAGVEQALLVGVGEPGVQAQAS